MRVVFNLLSTLKPKTGVGHYAARLFAALHAQLPADALHGFPSGALADIVRRLQLTRGGTGGIGGTSLRQHLSGVVKAAVRGVGRGCVNASFRAACRRGGFDLYHEPNYVPLPGRVPTVITIHDLSVILHPEWHPADRVRQHERDLRRAVADARHVITVSRFIRRQVIDHLGVEPERVTAVHNGVGPEYFVAGPAEIAAARAALGLPDNYLLFVGTIEPRKNVPTLLRAYCDLPSELRQRCPLVLAGGWGWKSADVAELFRREAADKGVLHLGYTDDRHLSGLYAGARALVFPSFHEGFGLPPLETLAAGGAVIAAQAEAVREVLDDHAHYVEALDVAGWRDVLARAITDNDWLQTLRAGGRQHASAFGWDRCAAETASVYRVLLERRRRAA